MNKLWKLLAAAALCATFMLAHAAGTGTKSTGAGAGRKPCVSRPRFEPSNKAEKWDGRATA